jgi:hypothetical protein
VHKLSSPERTIIHIEDGALLFQRGLLFRPLTCVEVVKRMLGIGGGLVFTPYQLFKRLAASAVTPASIRTASQRRR